MRAAALVVEPRFTVGVSAIVLNEQDHILFVRHRFRADHGWTLPGGFVKQEEDLEAPLHRELKEETSYGVNIVSLLSTDVSSAGHVDVRFLALISDGHLEVDPIEILDAQFFPRENLPATLKSDHLRTINLAFAQIALFHAKN
jgi:8-oxo-dGTP diphosphatase